MAGLFRNLLQRVGWAKSAPPKARQRVFHAATPSLLTSSWSTVNYSADQELYRTLDVLRARTRELTQNNDYAKKFLQMVGNNIVGPEGFVLQSRAPSNDGSVDKVDSASIERAFARWSRRGTCEVTGQFAFADLCRLIIRTVARDGECLVRRIRDKSINAFGYAHQVIDIDRLYTQHIGTLKNGNFVCLGVEINSYGQPVAYHIRTAHPMEYGQNSGNVQIERIPASDIFHLYVADRAEQHRGVPWMHTAMMRLQMLGGFEEAAVIAARVGAAKMGFYTSPDGAPPPGGSEVVADGSTGAGQFVQDATAGTFEVLPEGYDFKSFDPDYPHAHYEAFVKACLRGISSGLGVAYNSLGSDLEGVNFSSIRAGLLEERDNWMALQGWLVEAYLTPTYEEWLGVALLREQITGPAGQKLPFSRIDKFSVHTWQPRRWAWVDPLKDVEAQAAAVKEGFKSRRQVIAEQGGDIGDVWAELAAEKIEAAKLNIVLGDFAVKPIINAPPNGDNNA